MKRTRRTALNAAVLGAFVAACGTQEAPEPAPGLQDAVAVARAAANTSPPPAPTTLGVVARPIRGVASRSDLQAWGIPDDAGLFVAHVHQDGPGALAGLQQGDVLRHLEGRILESGPALDSALSGYGAGDEVFVEYWRDGAPQEVAIRLEEAPAVYQRACDRGDPEGCFAMGTLLAEAEPVQAGALQHFTLGCERGSASACVRLGRALEAGELGAPKNLIRAAGLYESACRQEVPEGCFGLANVYATAGSPLENQERATTLYQRVCGWRNAEACHAIAVRYASGTGIAKDVQRSRSLHGIACDLGSQESCQQLAARISHLGQGSRAEPGVQGP
jgi:TPR repeat protein